VKLSGVRPSVRPSYHSPAAAAGLLLSAVPTGDTDRQRRPPGAQQQPRRSTARNGKCGQCHVVS